jgi:hypothetical protein
MRAALLALIVLALGAPSAAGHAQLIRGRVVDATTLRPIGEVDVILSDSSGGQRRRVLADSVGQFRLLLPGPGSYGLRAEHLGYQTTVISGLRAASAEEIELELRMGIEAIPIEPLFVIARRRERLGRLSEYYDRRDFNQKLGLGRFVTREDIERRMAMETADLLRTVPGVRVLGQSRAVVIGRQGGACTPAVFVDGMQMNRGTRANVNEYVTPEMIEGIEIYRGAAESPAQYQDRGGCGTILIWTRRGDPSGRPWSWWRAAIGGGVLLVMILLAR